MPHCSRGMYLLTIQCLTVRKIGLLFFFFSPKQKLLFAVFPGKLSLKVNEWETDYSQISIRSQVAELLTIRIFFLHVQLTLIVLSLLSLSKRFENAWVRIILLLRFCFGTSEIIILLTFQFVKTRKCL